MDWLVRQVCFSVCLQVLFPEVYVGGPIPRIGMYNTRDRAGGLGMIMLAVLVAIGVGKTLYTIYVQVKKVSRLGLEVIEDYILEVD